jgi:hypothetical protein
MTKLLELPLEPLRLILLYAARSPTFAFAARFVCRRFLTLVPLPSEHSQFCMLAADCAQLSLFQPLSLG